MPFTSKPAAGYISNTAAPAPAEEGVGGGTAFFEQFLAWCGQFIGGQAPAAVTLASDSFTPDTAGAYVLDTESAASTDTLSVIGQGGVPDGARIELRIANNARTINVDHGIGSAGQILLDDAQDLNLTGTTQRLVLEKQGAAWYEAGRHFGDQKSAFRTFWGLAIGSAVQAFHANLSALAGLTGAADRLAYFTGSGAMALATFTAFGRSLVAAADAATARATLGVAPPVVISTFYNEYTDNANLTADISEDDNAPSAGEGTEILSASVTVASGEKVRLRAQAVAGSSAARQVTMFVQRGSIVIATTTVDVGAAIARPMFLEVEDSPGAGSHTYSVRAGATASTSRLNGFSNGRLYGGTLKATLAGEVIKA